MKRFVIVCWNFWFVAMFTTAQSLLVHHCYFCENCMDRGTLTACETMRELCVSYTTLPNNSMSKLGCGTSSQYSTLCGQTIELDNVETKISCCYGDKCNSDVPTVTITPKENFPYCPMCTHCLDGGTKAPCEQENDVCVKIYDGTHTHRGCTGADTCLSPINTCVNVNGTLVCCCDNDVDCASDMPLYYQQSTTESTTSLTETSTSDPTVQNQTTQSEDAFTTSSITDLAEQNHQESVTATQTTIISTEEQPEQRTGTTSKTDPSESDKNVAICTRLSDLSAIVILVSMVTLAFYL